LTKQEIAKKAWTSSAIGLQITMAKVVITGKIPAVAVERLRAEHDCCRGMTVAN
jgi:hypothetical protein